jgi:hypothetical protein
MKMYLNPFDNQIQLRLRFREIFPDRAVTLAWLRDTYVQIRTLPEKKNRQKHAINLFEESYPQYYDLDAYRSIYNFLRGNTNSIRETSQAYLLQIMLEFWNDSNIKNPANPAPTRKERQEKNAPKIIIIIVYNKPDGQTKR